MPNKDERAKEAAKHIALMKQVFSAEISSTLSNARIFAEGEGEELALPEPRFDSTETDVTNRFAADVLFDSEGKVTILDPASFTRPGGNYEGGSFGPEQQLCSESDLYPILCGMQDKYYAENRDYQRGQLFTNRAMLLPDVMFTRGNVRKADIIVMAAPNRERALQNHRDVKECDGELQRRIEAAMRIAAVSECDVLILPAFGCGFAGNDTDAVISLFKGWLDAHPGMFKKVVFAVQRSEFDAFHAAFGKPAPEEKPKSDEDENDDDDDGFVLDFDLPEGITLR
ncbi:MAG: TIGR02452 family protein [Coriobacteriales bacterium]|jgi:uncharacterized protein (TIGR02452 family)